MKKSEEFKRFDDAMTLLLKVPHSELKAKLEAEKTVKAKERKPKKASASRDKSDRGI